MRTLLLLMLTAATGMARADTQVFDFTDPKGVNAVQFLLDSPLEPILGFASGVSGTLAFDAADPEKLSGRIVVDATTITFPNPKMTEVLHGKDWLDTATHGLIAFTIRRVVEAERIPGAVGTYNLRLAGDFSLHGVVRPLTVKARLARLPGRLGDRVPDAKGDLLVLRTEFTILRTDFGIQPALGFDKVANEIRLNVALVGQWVESE